MGTIGAWLLSFLASSTGQSIITWLVKLLWTYASGEAKEKIAGSDIKKLVKEKLVEYDAVIAHAQLLASDGLTDAEKEEIRNAKAKIESDLINIRP